MCYIQWSIITCYLLLLFCPVLRRDIMLLAYAHFKQVFKTEQPSDILVLWPSVKLRSAITHAAQACEEAKIMWLSFLYNLCNVSEIRLLSGLILLTYAHLRMAVWSYSADFNQWKDDEFLEKENMRITLSVTL